jgi:uncharacterized protein YbjT (DUF2867 family)
MSSLPIIVVTGATGTTGKEVVKQLSTLKDVKVRAAVRSLEKARELPEGVEVVQMDYTKPETVLSAFRGATKLYLLPPGDQNYDRAKVTQVMVEAAQKAGIQYIVCISAIAIDREPILSVDRQVYAQVEEIVANSGITYTILRASWFNQNFITPIFGPQIKQGILRLPVAEGRTGWVDVRDIAAVAMKALTQTGHENTVYNLTGPEALSTSEVTAILSRVSGREIKFMDVSEETYAQMLKDFGVREWYIQKMLEITRKWRLGVHADITQVVEKMTGKKPISFEQFAIDHADLLKELDHSEHAVLAT